MFRSILVAVDGSPAATCALKEAVDIARSEGARLTLISVAKVPPWPMGIGPFATPVWTEADLEYSAREVLEEAEKLVPEDVPFASVVGCGPAPAAILKRVNAACHDLVVMGSRGLGPAGALLLGSVSRAVVAQSPVPVLVTREERAEPLEPAFAT
jgi:nucleotide-binding universal stress UspA family protein